MNGMRRQAESGILGYGSATEPGESLGVTRRKFIKSAIAAGVVAGASGATWAAERSGEMPQRTLGNTGEKISAIGLGGYHIGVPSDEQEGIRIIRSAIDRG